MKRDKLLRRCHLKGAEGDAMHAVLCGASHTLRLLLNSLRAFLRQLYAWLGSEPRPSSEPIAAT